MLSCPSTLSLVCNRATAQEVKTNFCIRMWHCTVRKSDKLCTNSNRCLVCNNVSMHKAGHAHKKVADAMHSVSERIKYSLRITFVGKIVCTLSVYIFNPLFCDAESIYRLEMEGWGKWLIIHSCCVGAACNVCSGSHWLTETVNDW